MHAAWSSTRKEDLKIVSSADPDTNNVKSSSMSPEEPPQQNDDISKSGNMNEKTVSVVTLTGDNKGATMHVGSSSKKEGSIHIHRAYKTNQTEETTDDDEENSRNDSTEKDEAEKVIVNSNIQSINNSMMLHGSISGRDPGVRVILPQYSVAVPVPPQEPIKHAETHRKGEVNKLSYQPRPVIRRRCLRGLLLEPSDSEPDNPHKPRRHGCKVRCGEIRKD
ncbi:hypothetical protein RIF29_12828 [Crotalaria pallida]|uniref:Uncharacterized protein n=1 Tax=Crotalaria pallida TaxID=3830 RepID=A0AAN9INL4_CROPI